MLSWLLNIFSAYYSLPLSKEESKHADECKRRTLKILNDALKKKDNLLVDDPDKYANGNIWRSPPFISTHLVKDLISQLQKVTFRRNKVPQKEKNTIAYVRPSAEPSTIYLCGLFFQQHECLQRYSCPATLIHEVSHLLGYGHTIIENEEKVKTSPQYKLCPVSVQCIEKAFSLFMNHEEPFTDGSYSCCGETFRDTLCEKSIMTCALRHPRESIVRNMLSNFMKMSLFEDIFLLTILKRSLIKNNDILNMTEEAAVLQASLPASAE